MQNKKSRIIKTILIGMILIMLILAGCTKKEEKVEIKIGTQNYAEVIIAANMAKELIESQTDYKVEVIPPLGANAIIEPALQKDEINIASLVWTGGSLGVLHPAFENDVDLKDAKWRDARYVWSFLEEHSPDTLNRIILPPLGWENTYAITVRRETAEEFGLKKVSDLRGLSSNLVMGLDEVYLDREIDGYYPLLEWYQLEPFKRTVSMQVNLLYMALKEKQVDVGVAYSSDARVYAYDLVWLEDDLNFYPPYEGTYGINLSLIEKVPEIPDILRQLSGKIDIETIRRLNYEVDIDGKSHEDVARKFLEEIGLLEPKK